ncbi:hypothetical protein STP4a_084 [Salmonella phage STP4-a]|uniref:Uncharacterized protein n=1 Tax=Salmonella phage STP4-a TaxID=1445860 RepID=A0A0B4L989_9CAUD|nr:hypothetical protein STP4a_084 [Salmonella phage STP4-a]AHJ86939.1 hypothetical protein STP4a_084 [Salmonella phage STP4-a]
MIEKLRKTIAVKRLKLKAEHLSDIGHSLSFLVPEYNRTLIHNYGNEGRRKLLSAMAKSLITMDRYQQASYAKMQAGLNDLTEKWEYANKVSSNSAWFQGDNVAPSYH